MGNLLTKMESRPRIHKTLSAPVEVPIEPIAVVKPPVILGIGLPRSLSYPGMEIRRPANERAAIELLRQTEFDLMLVSAKPEEEKVWNLMRLIRRHWPGLRWVLFSEDCTDAQEIQARSLGAVCVTADQQTIEELAFG
jgi:DNA-binding NarL/FixJ family response regulator